MGAKLPLSAILFFLREDFWEAIRRVVTTLTLLFSWAMVSGLAGLPFRLEPLLPSTSPFDLGTNPSLSRCLAALVGPEFLQVRGLIRLVSLLLRCTVFSLPRRLLALASLELSESLQVQSLDPPVFLLPRCLSPLRFVALAGPKSLQVRGIVRLVSSLLRCTVFSLPRRLLALAGLELSELLQVQSLDRPVFLLPRCLSPLRFAALVGPEFLQVRGLVRLVFSLL